MASGCTRFRQPDGKPSRRPSVLSMPHSPFDMRPGYQVSNFGPQSIFSVRELVVASSSASLSKREPCKFVSLLASRDASASSTRRGACIRSASAALEPPNARAGAAFGIHPDCRGNRADRPVKPLDHRDRHQERDWRHALAKASRTWQNHRRIETSKEERVGRAARRFTR